MNQRDTRYPPIGSLDFGHGRSLSGIAPPAEALIRYLVLPMRPKPVVTPEGLVTKLSKFGPKETMDRFAKFVTEHGLTIFARVDHAEAAAAVGLQLGPTEVLIFGNAEGGTPLMLAAQMFGIDLPLKALVWQDEEGKTHLAYNEPNWLAGRHGVEHETWQTLARMSAALASVVQEAS